MDHSNRNFRQNCTKNKNKNPRKDIKQLQKIYKRLRQEYSTTTKLEKKILIFERMKILKGHITEIYTKGRSKRVNHMTEEIRGNVDNGGKIWELKRKIEKKVHTPYSITNTDEIKLENRSDIQEEYTKNYKTLLKTREPDNDCKRMK